jgi:hypothetical protein
MNSIMPDWGLDSMSTDALCILEGRYLPQRSWTLVLALVWANIGDQLPAPQEVSTRSRRISRF